MNFSIKILLFKRLKKKPSELLPESLRILAIGVELHFLIVNKGVNV